MWDCETKKNALCFVTPHVLTRVRTPAAVMNDVSTDQDRISEVFFFSPKSFQVHAKLISAGAAVSP